MKTPTQNLLQNLIYTIIWLVVFILPIFVHYHTDGVQWTRLLMFWMRILPFFVLFLIHNYLLVPYLLQGKWKLYFGVLAVLIVVLFSVIHPLVMHNTLEPMIMRDMVGFRMPNGVDSVFMHHHGPPMHGDGVAATVMGPPKDLVMYRMSPGLMSMMFNDYVIAILVVGFNIAILYLFKSIRDERQIRELEALNLQAELNYLKAQINPHFFMNTLNNIHALIDIDGERAKNSVIELSKIMRYVLYEADKPGIQLSNEIQFIENYVGLMRIRFSDEIDIRMEFPAPVPEVKIPPMLLVMLVENAFKHGISYRRDSFIHTALTVSDGRLLYRVENSVGEVSTGKSGVGMENMRKRLNLLFGEGRYTLSTRQTIEKYSVVLEIPVLQ